MHCTATNTSLSLSSILSSLRSYLPAWARDRRLSRHLTSGLLPLFLAAVALSWLLTPSPALYTPGLSAVYTPPPQPPAGPPITTSIIVPTYHERANLAPLVRATFAALPPALAARTEILFVDDDSQDGTEEEVARLREEGYPTVELLTRPRSAGETGLSSAVIRGFERARGARLVVMDADLQHPPSAIPRLLAALESGEDSGEDYSDADDLDADWDSGEGEGGEGNTHTNTRTPMALGTRYGRGPGAAMDASWPLYRRVISWGARILARPLTTASDPMTGFFAVRKDAFTASHPLSPLGFKIALELLLALPHASHPPEIPYAFGVRTLGASKLSSSVIIKYLLQLVWLYRRMLGGWWHVLVGGGIVAVVAFVRRGGVGWVVRAVAGERVWRRLGGERVLGGGHGKRGRGLLPMARTAGGRLE
ncbi:lipopolysaccharide heptosyltransferase I [Mycena galericulata]|nr:lipopolysaccharide heptosyltransferase I [Mycena galericulata]